MKNTKFKFDGKTFVIYNTLENLYCCVELKKNGQRRKPKAKTLKTFKPSVFQFGVNTGGIKIIK